MTSEIVVSTTDLATVRRSIIVRGSTVEISRETLDGRPCGSLAIYPAYLGIAREAIAGVRAGRTGLVGSIPLRSGSIALVARGGNLAIGLRDAAGLDLGRPSILRGAEIDRLDEAVRIAQHVAAEAA